MGIYPLDRIEIYVLAKEINRAAFPILRQINDFGYRDQMSRSAYLWHRTSLKATGATTANRFTYSFLMRWVRPLNSDCKWNWQETMV